MCSPIKSGPMLWYKRNFFGGKWKTVHSILYSDNSLVWYKDRSLKKKRGEVILRWAPGLIVLGPYTTFVPFCPSLPRYYKEKQLLAFGEKGKSVVYCFLCPSAAEIASWIAAIISVLLPPPSLELPPIPIGLDEQDTPVERPKQLMQDTPVEPPKQHMQDTPVESPEQHAQDIPVAPPLPPSSTRVLDRGYVSTGYQGAASHYRGMAFTEPVYHLYNDRPVNKPHSTPKTGGGIIVHATKSDSVRRCETGGFSRDLVNEGTETTCEATHHYSSWGCGAERRNQLCVNDTSVAVNNHCNEHTSQANFNSYMTTGKAAFSSRGYGCWGHIGGRSYGGYDVGRSHLGSCDLYW